MKKRKVRIMLLSFIIVAALVIVPVDKVQAANTISGSAGTLVTENVTVPYDGKVHYPQIEFTPKENGSDYTLLYYISDATSQSLYKEGTATDNRLWRACKLKEELRFQESSKHD